MKNAKLLLTIAIITLIAVGAVAAKVKSANGQGNLFFCTGTPLTCQPSSSLSDVQGIPTGLPTALYFTGGTIGSSCSSTTSGCNNTHPSVVLRTNP